MEDIITEDFEGEIWKDIEDYEGLYQVSNLGRIKALEKIRFFGKYSKNKRVYPEKILKVTYNKKKDGYYIVTLSKNGIPKSYTVHRLVLKAFSENIDNLPYINHIDGNKRNNNLCNLEWCTASYNSKHAFILGKQPSAFKSENNVANKKCICLKTNKIFNSLKQAWKETNYPKCYQTFLRNIKNENYKDTKVKLWN